MIVTYHTIRRMRQDVVSRFCFGGDPRAWTTVARVREERTFASSSAGGEMSTAWVYSRSHHPHLAPLVGRSA